MKYAYDLHIHSALSPCADDDMTPNNIAGMAAIKGLDVISLTDHNSCGNVRALTEIAKNYNITVIPGMEVETQEEVHVVCYFPTIEACEKMQEIVKASMLPIKNNKQTFGNQFYMDADDEIIGEEDILLVNAITLSFQEVFKKTEEFGGIAVPAHIDRQSYSVLSNLGFLPPDVDINVVEITTTGLLKYEEDYKNYEILTNSDAHTLGNIAEKERFLYSLHKNEGKFSKFFVEHFLGNSIN